MANVRPMPPPFKASFQYLTEKKTSLQYTHTILSTPTVPRAPP